MSRYRFVMNVRTRVVHRLPTTERCNADQMKEKKKFVTLTDAPFDILWWKCQHCWPISH